MKFDFRHQRSLPTLRIILSGLMLLNSVLPLQAQSGRTIDIGGGADLTKDISGGAGVGVLIASRNKPHSPRAVSTTQFQAIARVVKG